MGDIKSAFEIAMEKANQIEAATPEEKLKWKFEPQGEQLAVKYLKDNIPLAVEIAKFQSNEKKFVVNGAMAVLTRNIELPRNEVVQKNTARALEGIKSLARDKHRFDEITKKIQYIFQHYSGEGEEQKKQAFEQVKRQFMVKLQQALQQQGAGGRVDVNNLNVEQHPQFQEEWRRVLSQMDEQYMEHLNEYRRELMELS